MSQPTIPVTVPYGSDSGAVGSVVVEAVAPEPRTAQAVAQQIAATWLRLRHPGQPYEPRAGRARVGGGEAIDGPYAYVLSRRDHVHRLPLPVRVDDAAGEALRHALDGLEPAETFAVIFDLRELASINTTGLAALVAQRKRLRLSLFGATQTVRHVLETVGLARLLPMHDDLAGALAALGR